MKNEPTRPAEGALYERLRAVVTDPASAGVMYVAAECEADHEALLSEAADVLEAISEFAESDPEGESDTDELKANWHGYHTAQEEVLSILRGTS